MATVDHERIKRNISKMVDQGAPETDIDAYVSSEGVTPAQLRSIPSSAKSVNGTQDQKERFTSSQRDEYADKQGSTGAKYPYLSRFFDAAATGTGPAATSLYEAARDSIRGPEYLPVEDQGNFGDHYARHLAVNKALREDANAKTNGIGGFATDLAGGIASGGPGAIKSVLGAAKSVVMNPIQTGKNLASGARDIFMGAQGARSAAAAGTGQAIAHGAAYGAIQGGFSGAGPKTFDFEDASYGARDGALIGFALGRLPVVSAIGAKSRLARAETQAAERSARLQDMSDAGVTPLPIAASGPTSRATASALATLPGGAPIRDAARASIADLDAATQKALLDAAGGKSAPVIGEDVQALLRQNLERRTFKRGETERMTNPELENITGPVGKDGFGPLKAIVPPVKPRTVDPLNPEQFREPIAPRTVKPVEPQPRYTPFDDIAHNPELMQRHTDLTAAQYRIAKTHNEVLMKDWQRAADAYDAALTRAAEEEYNKIFVHSHPDIAILDKAHHTARIKSAIKAGNWEEVVLKPVARASKVLEQARARVDEAAAQHLEVGEMIAANKRVMHSDRVDRYTQAFHAEDGRARQEAERRTVAEHENELRRATGESDARARQRAQDETAADRARAQQDADRIRAQKQGESDADYQRRVDAGETFKVGRTRERTYPDEFDAAYELISRETPNVPVPLLGRKAGHGTDGKPGVRLETKTATSELLHDLVNEEALTLRFPKKDSIFVQGPRTGDSAVKGHGDFTPEARSVLISRFGPDIAETLMKIGQRRAGDRRPPSVESIRNLRTKVWQEKAELARARRMGETRGTDEAALTRLHGAITEDLHATLKNHDAQGVRASRMLSDVDTGYAQFMGEIRKPLAKMFGEKVSPGQAMDYITQSATNPNKMNSAVVRNFMRVMSEKSSPNLGAAAILTHIAGGEKNMLGFLDAYRSIQPSIKNEMFRGAEGLALRQNLDRLARTGLMLKPFEKIAGGAEGTDLTKFIGAAYAVHYHFWPTFAAAIGTAAASRFMTSPRYVEWLTQVPAALQAAGRGNDKALPGLVARLGAGTEQDHGLGRAAARALIATVHNTLGDKNGRTPSVTRHDGSATSNAY
jgi:hypothetical protein